METALEHRRGSADSSDGSGQLSQGDESRAGTAWGMLGAAAFRERPGCLLFSVCFFVLLELSALCIAFRKNLNFYA